MLYSVRLTGHVPSIPASALLKRSIGIAWAPCGMRRNKNTRYCRGTMIVETSKFGIARFFPHFYISQPGSCSVHVGRRPRCPRGCRRECPNLGAHGNLHAGLPIGELQSALVVSHRDRVFDWKVVHGRLASLIFQYRSYVISCHESAT